MTRLPWFLLAISLAFNVFFAGSFIKARSDSDRPRTPRERGELLGRQLNLTEPQQKEFQALLDESDKIRSQYAGRREAYFAELIKDNPDEKVLEDYMAGDTARQRRLAMLGVTRRMMAILTPQQRQQFAQLCTKPDASAK